MAAQAASLDASSVGHADVTADTLSGEWTEDERQRHQSLARPSSDGHLTVPRLHRTPLVLRGIGMSFSLFATDVLVVVATMLTALWLRHLLGGQIDVSFYARHWSALLIFPGTFAMMHLYRGVAWSAAEELRRLCLAVSFAFLCLGAMTFLAKQGESFSRLALGMAWVMTLMTVPFARYCLRLVGASTGRWGHPTVVLGAGDTGRQVIRRLIQHPRIGLRPVVVLDDDPAKQGTTIDGVPVVGRLEDAVPVALDRSACHAILAIPRAVPLLNDHPVLRALDRFPHLILVPTRATQVSLWVHPTDLGGTLGIELNRQLLSPIAKITKRTMELMVILVLLPLALIAMALIALLIRLDSPGPLTFTQARLGRRGERFAAWKFRTMVADADARLADHLDQDEAAAEEWASTAKLRCDPRVTRVGWWLRRTSLDELPQLWNVLMGDMSLVGPRPIRPVEESRYGNEFHLYKQVRPGLTGLWQVSGRNDLSYDERVVLDAFYVRNWSPWLDLWIVLRTLPVVISGQGAY